MSSLVYRMANLLCHVLQEVPVGTNLGLFHLLWTLLSGRLLGSRGAVIAALADSGLPADAVRRAWAALAYGQWQSTQLLPAWQQVVAQEGCWQAHRYGGYRPVAADSVGFFRPHLRGCATKHYASPAGKALPAIVLGMLVQVGSVGRQRVPLPRALVRAQEDDHSDAAVQRRLLGQARDLLAPDEALVCDAGFGVAALQEAGIKCYVVRGARNFTARRAQAPAYSGRGRRATRGTLVRPLPRHYKGRSIAATPPDRVETWTGGPWWRSRQRHTLRAEFWDNLVLPDAKPGAATFSCIVLHDPRYAQPLLLNSPLALSGEHLHGLYQDRWPVEQLPLAAKQMLGASRQFVFAEESRQRLPELALLAGAMLMYVAATHGAVATGFWDRAPQPTCGRLRRLLARVDLKDVKLVDKLPEQLRKKQSCTAHLPKGILAHRRHKASTTQSSELLLAA
jgi:hypothetical protein